MNNFPDMTEEQRELEIASVKEMRSHVDFLGHASGFDAEFLMRCADAYLAMLTAEPIHQFIVNSPDKDGYAEWADCNNDYFSEEPLDMHRVLYTAPPALRVPDGWIKCSERVPEGFPKQVQVAYISESDGNLCLDVAQGMLFPDGAWRSAALFYDAKNNSYRYGEFKRPVTHWMPLPAPPEASNEQ